MPAGVIKYSGIYAKTAALNATLLKYEDYYALASCETVKDFAEALGNYGAYKESSAEAVNYGANRVAIERSLLTSLYKDFAALYSFVTDMDSRKYLDTLFLQYVLEIIKRIIRRIYDHRRVLNIIPKYGDFMLAHTGLDLRKIAVSEDIDALCENVRGSEIYPLLSNIRGEASTLFDYETHIDFYGIMKRNKYQERLKEPALTPCRLLNGAEIDLQNIMWTYRAKEFYKTSTDKLFTYLIPVHQGLSAEDAKALVTAGSTEEFLAALGKTRYKDVFGDLSAGAMEMSARKYLDERYEEHRKTYSLMSVMAHLYFKRREIRNLTTLIECVRYKLPPESSLKRLCV